MDLDSQQPKTDSELISLIKQIISLFNSKPDSESELVSLIIQTMHLGISVDSDSERTQESELLSLISEVVSLKHESELVLLIKHIMFNFRSTNWEPRQLVSYRPQAEVKLGRAKFRVSTEDVQPPRECHFASVRFWISTTINHFHCGDCNGKNHEEYDKIPVEVKHPLHPKHSLQLVVNNHSETRECYCCGNVLFMMFYYCSACDCAISLFCITPPPGVLSVEHPTTRWHEHTLALFPSHTSYPCSLCALKLSSCPFYILPPCDYAVHKKCLTLPRVIRISRHIHRISFIPSFNNGDRCCRVCQRKIDKDYGSYSCIKEGCSYAAHSRCATQRNVWDWIELEGVPEITEEEVEPFVSISDGIIQHFSHQHHYLRLDENVCRDYDDKKICYACITPIYFGNFYSCMECEFILHESCANLSRRIYHPTHQHRLILKVGIAQRFCSTCNLVCTNGMFYECGEKCSGFYLHVQYAATSEPFAHKVMCILYS